MATAISKACSRCGVIKDATEFGKRARSKDGLTVWCKPCNSAYGREHYAKNREKKNAQAAAWYEANKEARNAQIRQWYRDNADRAYETGRRWIETHREQHTEWFRRRRAILREVAVGAVDLDALWTGKCGICCVEIDRNLAWPDPMSKSVDHIVPISRGGAHAQDNLQWTHWHCNNAKGAKLPAVEEVA